MAVDDKLLTVTLPPALLAEIQKNSAVWFPGMSEEDVCRELIRIGLQEARKKHD